MAGEWPVKLLGEVAVNFDSRRVPLSSREREQRRGHYPYYGATGIMDYVDNFLFEGLHVLVAEDGSVERDDGRPFVQLVDGKFWVNNHAHVLRAATNRDTDTRFLFYALSTIGVRPFMTGSVQPKLTQGNLNRIPIPYPPEPDRRAIAHILGTLDDKIELNRRMSETLEAMARALFKAWFVDFEPARAKMQDRWRRGQSLPGLPAHLYDLFPDRLVDSELGEIPEGWRVVRLGDLISFEKGRKPPVSYPLPCKGYLPVVLIENFNGIVSSYALPKGMTIAQEKDVLMVMDGASSGRVETGHYGIVGSTLAKITLREGSGVGTHFLYYALKLLEPEIREHLTGTSIPHADKNWISAQMVCFPNKGELLFYFEEIVGQIRERIRALRGESRTLAALRDVLLPKLIRGEIRVKEAERFVQDFGGERR